MAQQELGSGDTRRRPIALGGALVTMVEPHRGHEVAYNRWYERDHYYAGCLIGAWTLSGARYVATADLKRLRYPESSPVCPDPTSGSFVSIYWILAGKFGEWMKWGTDQVNWLHQNDRMFEHRDHIHTVMYRFRAEFPGHDDAVPVELALDHRSPYFVMVVGEPAEGVELGQIDSWFRARDLGAEVMAEFTPVPLQGDAPKDVPRDSAENRFTQLYFVDDDLPAVWDTKFASLGADLERDGLGRIVFASPFRATVPGTDTYTDQLW